MAGEYYFWLGASADAETGSREPSPAVSALTGFDPAREGVWPHCSFWDYPCTAMRPTEHRK